MGTEHASTTEPRLLPVPVVSPFYRLWVVEVHRVLFLTELPAWHARPDHAAVIAPAFEGVYSLPESLATIQVFNTDPARRIDRKWLVMQPVAIVYEGDLLPGAWL